MTVRNIDTVVVGNQVTVTWDMDLDYGFVLLDGSQVANPSLGVTNATFPYSESAYLEILESDDPSFDAEANASEYPRHKVFISWEPSTSPDIASYNIEIDGTVVSNVLDDGRTTNYTYESARLSGSIEDNATFTDHTIDVKCVDQTGNIGLSSQLPFQTLNSAPPVQGLAVSQTVAGEINLDVTAPNGW